MSEKKPPAPPRKKLTQALSDDQSEIIELLYQHRLLTSRQLQEMIGKAPYKDLDELVALGLVDQANERRHSPNLCSYLNSRGLKLALATGADPALKKAVTPEFVVSKYQQHQIAANDACLALSREALARGDECPPTSWVHEQSYSIGTNKYVRPDAVLTYTHLKDPKNAFVDRRFIEVDRSTENIGTLVHKIRNYAYYATYRPNPNAQEPEWRKQFQFFPGLLIIIDANPKKNRALKGKKPPADPEEYEQKHANQRAQNLWALVGVETQIKRWTEMQTTPPPVLITTQQQLQRHGPWQPIFIDPSESTAKPNYYDWQRRVQPG